MKHGHKKGKAKAPSGKKTKPAAKIQANQGGGSTKKAGSTKTASARPSGKADAVKGRGNDSISFNNPVVANAFKRAVKKYPSAFKRLTD
jgi:hypothetical protein